ncbi:MAG TPA: hypothetical protein VM103_01650 [Candidatus Paceibacterota bacterium]|nr:hypothetical protein [Candidatus Paceibacterota bacterium]
MATDNNLLQALNLDAFEPKEQEELLLTLSDLVFRGSLVRLVERMDDKTRLDFSVLCVKGASEEAMADFIKERVPNADAVVRETIDELAADVAALNIPAAV